MSSKVSIVSSLLGRFVTLVGDMIQSGLVASPPVSELYESMVFIANSESFPRSVRDESRAISRAVGSD